ncbi:AraC family transcriptional regulator [Chryseobacterium sp. CT-SW4]|uniref:AraC family transcriptional regulator n=1 Tax=Chryseobacterium sp. SW-1 TaxID=3157343 RepID=UPI003B0221F5
MNEGISIGEIVDLLKRKLIARYVYLMLIVLGLYTLFFYFIVQDKLFAYYTLGYFCIISYTWILIHRKFSIPKLIHNHLVFAPLFASFIMLNLWKYSISSSMWLLPVPLIAYIFLNRKYVFIYTLYVIVIILLVNFLTSVFEFNYFSFNTAAYSRLSDTFIFVTNILVISLLLYYKDKIRKAETRQLLLKRESGDKVASANGFPDEDYEENKEKYQALFEKIRDIVEHREHFKETDFTISKLSSLLNTNSVYASKAIKYSGYTNFTHYLNTCRINNVKEMIKENSLDRITLMYIYTASGFSNQSTFNRVFKQIEGITPSEYISNLEESEEI